MRTMACEDLLSRIGVGETYVLVVSSHCHFCAQVLQEFESYGFSKPVLVVNYETCPGQVDRLFPNDDALPLIAFMRDGVAVAKAVGVDDIRNFEKKVYNL